MPSLVTKHYFSAIYLAGAKRYVGFAKKEEDKHKDEVGKKDHPTHRLHVINSIILSTAFLESLINELFQKICDSPSEYENIFLEKHIYALQKYWNIFESGESSKTSILQKYQNFLEFCEKSTFDEQHDDVYKNAKMATNLRNSLIHYKTNINIKKFAPKSLGAFSKKEFRNPLYRASFDDHTLNKILSSNTAKQIIDYYLTFTDDFFKRINIKHDYSKYTNISLV